MNKLLGIGLIVAIFTFAGCLQAPCGTEYDPVCGANNITYNNSCMATQAGTTVQQNGPCCYDSDGGQNLQVLGNAKSGIIVLDKCSGPEKIMEAICSNGVATSVTVDCPEGSICNGGTCIEITCTDSDGGQIKEEKGETTDGSTTETDECISTSTLKEFYCANGAMTSKQISCGSTMECDDGECIAVTCTDSDGGNDANTAGQVERGDQILEDVCSGTKVKEYYCENGNVRSQDISCPSGYSCESGACEPIVCQDSDGGMDQYTKGTTSYGTTSYTDSCYSTTSVVEYYCDGDTTIETEKVSCGSGYECVSGQCNEVECQVDYQELDDEDQRQQIASFDDADEVVVVIGDVVELNDEYLVELTDIDGTDAEFSLYENIGDYRDDDDICSFTLENETSDNDFCSEDIVTIEIKEMDSDSVTLEIDEYYVVEFYSQEGEISDWTDDSACEDDEVVFDSFTAEFFPYLTTDSSDVNVDNKKILLFDENATIRDIGTSSIEFDLDGENYELEDGDDFEYKNVDYIITLNFLDDGILGSIEIEQD